MRNGRLAAAFAALLALEHGAGAAEESASSDIDYRLGSGLQIPGTGFTLGGYATGSYDNPSNGPARANLDNLSLFIWWEGDSRFKLFSEIEYENFAADRRESNGKDNYLSLERAYVDYAWSDTTTLRGGKFLTPIGRWNLVHATPLVWTTSRPLTTFLPFPTNMTGVMVNGNLPSLGSVDYSIYGAGTDDLRTNPDLDPFVAAIGGHVNFSFGQQAQLGFSFADFEQSRTRFERKHLYGVDFFWTRNRFELSFEGIYRVTDDSTQGAERGAFVQLAAPLTDKLFAVLRGETFRAARQPDATELGVAGLNYRLLPGLVLKAEWIDSRHNTIHAPDGFLSSISILF
jgi:hypothetical protein